MTLRANGLFPEHRFVVFAEFLDALVGERVLGHLFDDFVGDGGDVGAGEGALRDVHGVADAGGDDFGLDAVGVEDLGDFGDQVGAADADVVEATDKGADEGGAGTGGQQGLVGRENQRHVDFDALCGQRMAGFEALDGHRDLDHHVLVDSGDLTAFADHAFGIGGRGFHLAADGPVDDGGDFGDDLLEVAAFFGDEGGVGGDAADDAHVIGFADVIHIGRVEEEFHGVGFFVIAKIRIFAYSFKKI